MSSVFVVTFILYLTLLSSFISSAAASEASFIGSKMFSLPSTTSSTSSSSSLSTRLVHYSKRLKREEGRDTDSLLSAPSSRLSHASSPLTKKVNHHRHHLNVSSFPRSPPSSSHLISSSSEGYSRSEALGPPAVASLLQRNMSDFNETSVLPRIEVLEVEKRFYWCIRYRVTGKTPRIREWFFNDQPLNLTETIKDLQSPAVVKNGSFDEG